MPEIGTGNPVETPGAFSRLRARWGLTREEPIGSVSCQISPFQAAGEANADSAILEVRGRLTRDVSIRIAAEADRLREGGARRVGLIVDSAGGELAGLDQAAAALLELRQSVGPGNFRSFNARRAASGGFLLLATAGRGNIFAGAGTETGGLGATLRVEDSSRLFEEGLLVTPHQLTAGRPDKITGAPGIPITEEQLATLQGEVESADRTFLSLVSVALGDSLEDVERMAGTGGVHDSATARQIGLIDEILDEREFRRLVESPQSTREVRMTTPAAAGAQTPATNAEVRTDADVPTGTTSDGTGVTVASPEVPAAAPAVEAGSTPPTAAASPAEDSRIEQLTAAVNQLTDTVGMMWEAQTTAQRQVQIEGFRQRVDARVGNPLTQTAADAVIAAVESMINAGAEPASVEALVASYEALPGIEDRADLAEQVTFNVEGADPVAVDVDFRDFGVVQGPRGEVAFNRQEAIETAGLIHGAKSGREVIQRLETAFRQDGRF